MSTALRVGVDLNSRCSKKCAAPATLAPSSREPTPTQTPTDAERTAGRYSVTTRRPPGSVVRRNAAWCSASTVWLPLCRAPASAAGRRGIGWRGRIGWRIGPGGILLIDQDQRDLAPLVDVGDLHPQLVADVHDVLDLCDALAPAEFGDVHQSVTTGQQRHERSKIRRLDHGPEEPLADRRQLRVGDGVDLVDRRLR